MGAAPTTYINMFWDDVYKGIINKNNEAHIMLLTKVEFAEGNTGYRTLGQLRSTNYSDKELYINYIVNKLGILNESYTTSEASSIVFSYVIKGGSASGNRALLSTTPNNKDLKWHRFNNLSLPVTMNIEDYGVVMTKPGLYDTFTRYITQAITTTGVRVYQIDVSNDKTQNKVTIMGGSELVWTDTRISEGALAGGFKREIQKSTIYFKDGVIKLRKAVVPSKPFRKVSLDKKICEYFLTMDIETININGKLTPYLICAHNGFKSISSYGLNQKDLFKKFIKQVLKMYPVRAQKLLVYAHNLGGFDGVFLLNHLTEYGEVKPMVFNGKLISITLVLNIDGPLKGKTIVFKDSFLLLPTALRTLCSVFKVSISKTFFPFHLTDIFYKGPLPLLYLWDNTITDAEYQVLYAKFVNKVWCFRTEAIKYCKIDCVALHQVLTKFNAYIFTLFSINAHSALTLPALAMRIFKAVFMPENTVYQISGEVEQAIRESYTGGAVDVYLPHNKIGTWSLSKVCRKLFAYDVNSLYPSIMASGLMPIGKPIAFEGDIRIVEPGAFGFFYCDITSPDNLQHPILQRRIKTSEGTRTIAGLGSWTGWVCSAEMDRCINLGYTFKLQRGYQFEVGDIFGPFISKMYEIKSMYNKGDALYEIAKLLMNSLYGKFGQRTDITKMQIFVKHDAKDRDVFMQMLDKWGESVHDWFESDTHLFVIRDSIVDLKSVDGEQNNYHGLDTNIAIAAAITSYARVTMSAFKNSSLFILYYSDTDSIFIDRELPEAFVGNGLGQLKLEHVIAKAVFLAPKVYSFITVDGKEVTKIKGISPKAIKAEKLGFNELSDLLYQDTSKELSQQKWFKSILEGTITVSDVAYNLKATSNKRQAIYIDGVYENTTPYFYDKIEMKK